MILRSQFPKRFPSSLPKARPGRLPGMLGAALTHVGDVRQSVREQSTSAAEGNAASRPPAVSLSAKFSSMPSAKPILDEFTPHARTSAQATSTPSQRLQQPLRHVTHQQGQQLKQRQKNACIALEKLELHGPRQAEWWTGKQPHECPGMGKDGVLYSLPQLSLSKESFTRESLQRYFDNTWTLTEVIMSGLQGEEAFTKPPYHDLRHPLIFYYGHPAALYVNKLRVAGLLGKPINPYFESVFETGVDEMSWDDLSKNKMPWPSVSEVHSYRKQVYATVSELIANLSDEQCAAVGQSSPLWALVMSFEHERIHLETTSVLIAEMSTQFLKFPKHYPAYHSSVPKDDQETQQPVAGRHYPINEFISVAPQQVTVGKPRDYPSFGWDNEYGRRVYDVPAFSASKFKVSNGEFLQFVRDGGYAKRELWSDDGWEWRAFRNAKWPSFWVRSGPQGLHHFDLRLTFDVVPMPWNWPATVNYHEAHAYATWYSRKHDKNVRILSELEHKAIRDPVEVNEGVIVDNIMRPRSGGKRMIDEGINTNLSCGSMSPVDQFKPNAQGFHDVFGNAWEWTCDYFCALPGFEVHSYYEDFSTPCFDGLHNVIQGGSFISTGNESSIFSRFHFRPHFFQHASFRLVEQLSNELVTSDTDAPGPYVGSYPYRRSNRGMKDSLVRTKLADSNLVKVSHFGGLKQLETSLMLSGGSLPSLSSISNAILLEASKLGIKLSEARAIDVGCGVGSVSFALAKQLHSVVGIDHMLENIDCAKALLEGKGASYTLQREGSLVDNVSITSGDDVRGMMEFRMADPMSLPAEMHGFDIVLLNDVVDRVSSPNAVLGRLGGVRGLVRHGGLLAVTSSFAWKDNVTPRSLWLGGFVDPTSGKEVVSEDTLKQRLSDDFAIVSETLQPVVAQTSNREWVVKLLSFSIWRRV